MYVCVCISSAICSIVVVLLLPPPSSSNSNASSSSCAWGPLVAAEALVGASNNSSNLFRLLNFQALQALLIFI